MCDGEKKHSLQEKTKKITKAEKEETEKRTKSSKQSANRNEF